ncbi:hypothetical protein Daus18300_000942 [Diaporthe australafricana]|uniref:Homeobox domain-containing protein n=1 Tax=Diaporthe australafricana TaxID=127596 RepID=A0ABR3Y0S8_9PEZI
MSNNFDAPLSTQSDWQGQQYSYLPPGENAIYAQSYGHGTASGSTSESQAQPRSAAEASSSMDVEPKTEPDTLSPPLSLRRGADPLGLRQQRQPSPIAEQSETPGDVYASKAAESLKEDSVASADTPGMSLGSNPVSSVSSAGQGPELPVSQSGHDDQVTKQEDDDEVIDEDDMVDGDTEAALQQMTPAERTAARRKMKRFRLTHQQTRFLMSEFAKQPHPDAAHRERLSREIPGLSPRQVQVWFQNRRAKIKRLTADDRERMIKMRAVPDDFDNVQALHSPYGAVHGLGTPMASPVGFGPGPYPDHLMRGPLVVDVRRAEGAEHMSSSGLSPAFGSIAFNSSASMSNPDLLTPMSQESSDRYDYSNHLTPLSAGPRTSNPFGRQGGMETGMSVQSHHSRQQMRPLQPLQLRETLTRSRSDNLQSPLRSSMSWKGDSIDYSSYHPAAGSPTPLSGRQQSVYQPSEGLSGSPSTTLGGYESSTYAGFPTAPLTAPSDFSLPRTPGFPTRPHDYSMTQMSAPIAPPNDFSQAFHASMGHTSRTPMRDQFGGGPLGDSSGDDYGGPGGELKRKRSFTIPQGSSAH